MTEHVIQFKGWQMGTWFILEQSEITQQLKLMLDNNDSGTKVKVRLDKNGLKLTKLNTLQLMTTDKKIPLSQIKNMSTDPKFPLCFFCTTRGPDGYLMKVIVIRCDREMCAKGIVNYYRTITYKKSVDFTPITNTNTVSNDTPAVVTANEQPVIPPVGKDGYSQIKHIHIDNKEVMDPSKEMETIEVPAIEINGVLHKEIEGAETPATNIKSLSAEVNAIEQNTLKKHPATISRQEYINAHETVRQFETEVNKRNTQMIKNGYLYPNSNAQVTVQNNSATNFQRKPERFYILNKEGKLVEVGRKRAKTVNFDPRVYRENHQRRDRVRSVRLSKKENGEIKPLALPIDSNVTSETTVQVNESNPGNSNNNPTVAQEPIYAQVKKRAVREPANEQMDMQAPNPDNGPSGNVQEVMTPSTPHRTVTFNNWSMDVQRSSKNQSKVKARPQSLNMPIQQNIPINTYVSKPIEKVYDNQSSYSRSLKHKEHYRPRVNSVTFNDRRQLVVYRKGDMLI